MPSSRVGLDELLGGTCREYALKLLKDDRHVRPGLIASSLELVMVIVPMSLAPPIKQAVTLTFNSCMNLRELIQREDLHLGCANNTYGLTKPMIEY